MTENEHIAKDPDPLAHLLSSRSFPELAAALRAGIDHIVQAWGAAVKQLLPISDKLTFEQLRNDLPNVLALIAHTLETADPQEAANLLQRAPSHGTSRYHEGYSQRELLAEYWLLRRTVVQELEAQLDRRLTTPEGLAMDLGIDMAVQQAVLAYTDHQQQQVRSATQTEAKFLSFLSHDLRNNLNTITLTLELLRGRLGQGNEFAEEAAEIDSLRDSITCTIAGMERMLQWERLRKRTAGGTAQLRRFDLHPVVADLVREHSIEAERKGLQLVNDVPRGHMIESDRELLCLILHNLITNAIKYSSKGTVRVASDADCAVSVSDEGPGIQEQQLKTIFQAFQRGESHGQSGVGLGLAIAAQAAKLLGGEIRVTSKVGVGSTFCVAVPQSAVGS